MSGGSQVREGFDAWLLFSHFHDGKNPIAHSLVHGGNSCETARRVKPQLTISVPSSQPLLFGSEGTVLRKYLEGQQSNLKLMPRGDSEDGDAGAISEWVSGQPV